MFKVLVYGATYNPGGVERFLVSYISRIASDEIAFDFVNVSKRKLSFNDIIEKSNCNVIGLKLPRKRKSIFKHNQKLDSFFKDNASRYDCVWFNMIDLTDISPIIKAHKYNYKHIIVHAHNSKIMGSLHSLNGVMHNLQHNINRNLIGRYATDFWACSNDAAKWFFKGDTLKKVKIIKNAIDTSKFKFDDQKRNYLRKQLNIKDSEFVIGNVGRLQYQKNQRFIINIFKKYLSINPQSKLILVGQGEDNASLKAQVKSMGLDTKVIFAGVQNNINEWLDVFDFFIFPSHFEGLGIAMLEAQANGLPVLASASVIPEEVKINSNFEFLSLDLQPEDWAQKIYSMNKNRVQYSKIQNNFMDAGYDIREASKRLKRIFDGWIC